MIHSLTTKEALGSSAFPQPLGSLSSAKGSVEHFKSSQGTLGVSLSVPCALGSFLPSHGTLGHTSSTQESLVTLISDSQDVSHVPSVQGSVGFSPSVHGAVGPSVSRKDYVELCPSSQKTLKPLSCTQRSADPFTSGKVDHVISPSDQGALGLLPPTQLAEWILRVLTYTKGVPGSSQSDNGTVENFSSTQRSLGLYIDAIHALLPSITACMEKAFPNHSLSALSHSASDKETLICLPLPQMALKSSKSGHGTLEHSRFSQLAEWILCKDLWDILHFQKEP